MLPSEISLQDQERSLDAFRELFEAYDCSPVETAILQRADPFLETAGEDLRRRMFMTTGSAGEELCLRPDFTIPVCLHHLNSKTDLPRRYGYFGPVFRQRGERPGEFLQAGIERLGKTEQPQNEDAQTMAIAVEACRLSDPDVQLTLKLGDPLLFHQLLKSLEIPEALQARLSRGFGRGLNAEKLDFLLSNSQMQSVQLSGELTGLLESRGDLASAVETMMHAHGLSPFAGRSPVAIAQRFQETYGPQDFGLNTAERKRIKSVLSAYLELSGPAKGAAKLLLDFQAQHQVSFGAELDGFVSRLQEFCEITNGELPENFEFSAPFARSLDYYTGFVFELFVQGAVDPVAGGGRYDRLMEILGSREPVPAVGFSLWIDRMPIWGASK